MVVGVGNNVAVVDGAAESVKTTAPSPEVTDGFVDGLDDGVVSASY
jgi:hypothetical protein